VPYFAVTDTNNSFFIVLLVVLAIATEDPLKIK
jgi:hypothetical protein